MVSTFRYGAVICSGDRALARACDQVVQHTVDRFAASFDQVPGKPTTATWVRSQRRLAPKGYVGMC